MTRVKSGVPLRRYVPPLLWGKSGHLQTVLYGKMGRISPPTPRGARKFLLMPDGATATFDLFEALGEHSTAGEAPAPSGPTKADCCPETVLQLIPKSANPGGGPVGGARHGVELEWWAEPQRTRTRSLAQRFLGPGSGLTAAVRGSASKSCEPGSEPSLWTAGEALIRVSSAHSSPLLLCLRPR